MQLALPSQALNFPFKFRLMSLERRTADIIISISIMNGTMPKNAHIYQILVYFQLSKRNQAVKRHPRKWIKI